jgi:uncharacterized protein (TIGR02996 family)
MELRTAFLEAILEAPDDDTPRLIFADWLDEHGYESERDRAEFIRLQCALAALEPDDLRRDALEDREFALLLLHEQDWLRPLRDARVSLSCQFERGFVASVTGNLGQFVAEAKAIYRIAPVQHAQLRDARRGFFELGQLPQVRCLRSLDLRDNLLDADHIVELAEAASLSELTALVLASNPLTDEGLRVLLREPVFQLRELNLFDTSITTAGVQHLAGSPLLASLAVLNLSHNPLDDSAVELLARSERVEGLTWLSLARCNLRSGSVRAMLESRHFARLETLDLRDNALPDDSATMLIAEANLPSLRTLYLPGPGSQADVREERLPSRHGTVRCVYQGREPV